MSKTADLARWCVRHRVPHYRGVVGSDGLPSVLPTNAFFIVNYQKTSEPGDHWVAFRKNGTHVDWFDSYGLKPDADDLVLHDKTRFRSYLRSHGVKTIKSNNWDLQQLQSEVCGHYACWFGLAGLPSATNPMWNGFTPNDQARNDVLIKRLVKLKS